MASDSGAESSLEDDFDEAASVDTGLGPRKFETDRMHPTSHSQDRVKGEFKLETDHMRPTSFSQDSVRGASLVPRQSVSQHSSSYDGELEAKNKTIALLTQKLKQYKSQGRMSSGSSRDFVDGQSPPPVLSPTSPSALGPAVFGSRHRNTSSQSLQSSSGMQVSYDVETSNSTDAEKLAGYKDKTLELVNERDSLQLHLNKVTEENDKLKTDLKEQQRLHQHTCDLKDDLEKMYSELLKKYNQAMQELEQTHSEVGLLKQQLETDDRRRLELENEKYRKYELKSKEQLHKVAQQIEVVEREKSALQARLDEQLAEALSATAYNPGQERIAELHNTIDVLCKDLRDTAITVKRQSETIRRMKHQTAQAGGDMVPRVQEEQAGPSGFRSRGHSSPENSNLQPQVPSTSERKHNPSEARPAPSEARHAPSKPEQAPAVTTSRQANIPSVDPSEEDIYGASVPDFTRHVRGSGPIDLDSLHESYEKSLSHKHQRSPKAGFSQSYPVPTSNYPIRATSRTEPLHHRASPEFGRRISQTYPLAAVNPPSYPVEQSDAAGDDSKVCPVCGETQPPGTTIDMLQTHVMNCLAKDDVESPRVESGGRVESAERICPVCSYLYPPSTPQQEFEDHVNQHFDNFTYAGRTDSFGIPK